MVQFEQLYSVCIAGYFLHFSFNGSTDIGPMCLPRFAVGISLAANTALCVIDGSVFVLLLKPRLSSNNCGTGVNGLRLMSLLAI